MKKAAGAILFAPDSTLLLLRRSNTGDHPLEWCFPGGGIEADESAPQATLRELAEETGYVPTGELVLAEHARRQAEDVDYTTFVGAVPEKFDAKLNAEHDAAAWVTREEALTMQIHPGARVALKKLDATELDVARMMRDGDLVSPQRLGNLMLVKLRITGTGVAYRPTIKEFVFRDPKLYLNDEFLQRCNGLPVIMEHPEKLKLNSQEFHERQVGTIFLPFLEGEDVWGIGKIYDAPTQTIIDEKRISTSPGVVFRPGKVGEKYNTESGMPLLIEGRPWLLDHLAICEAGVWDKGGAPTGVVNDVKADSTTTKDTHMGETTATTETVKADSELVGKKEGEKLDMILAHLRKCDERLDAADAAFKAHCAKMDSRMDAFEKKEPPKKEGEGKEEGKEGKETSETANLKKEGEPTPLAADKGKKDGEAQPGKEGEKTALEKEREQNHLKANDTSKGDSVRTDSTDLAALRERIDSLDKRMPTELTETERQAFVAVQARAEKVYQAFGDSKGAPRWLAGETIDQYRRRLLKDQQKHSKTWGSIDLTPFAGDALKPVEDQVYNDAMTAALAVETVPEGTLRISERVDRTGRHITSFHGDPEVAWGPFKQPTRRVTGFTTKFN